MNVRRMTSGHTSTVSATCSACGDRFRTIIDNPERAARAGVEHRCPVGVVGPLWTLILPPPTRTVRAVA